MKIVDYDGNWVGLAYYEHEYILDHFSTPDHWEIGFDIVYRLIFMLDDVQTRNERLRESFRVAFKRAFKLPNDHYETGDWFGDGGSVFWRIYWDKKAFDLRLLKKCEDNLDRCAEKNKVQVILLGLGIIPRSLEQISLSVKFNSK